MVRFLICVIIAISLVGCTNISENEMPAGGAVDGIEAGDEMPAELTAEDLGIVNEINEESTLFCELYGDMGNAKEPYFIETSGNSNATAVTIPKNSGPLRVKEIEIYDEEYDLYGMTVGISKEDFEEEIIKRGYTLYHQIESMKYKAYINGNIYVAINYDDNSQVDEIFVNALVDYNEWRGIE